MKTPKGTVFNIQRYSIHDGPGIRTVVFLKGCLLRCAWCSNPESWRDEPQLFYELSKCIDAVDAPMPRRPAASGGRKTESP